MDDPDDLTAQKAHVFGAVVAYARPFGPLAYVICWVFPREYEGKVDALFTQYPA